MYFIRSVPKLAKGKRDSVSEDCNFLPLPVYLLDWAGPREPLNFNVSRIEVGVGQASYLFSYLIFFFFPRGLLA